jgi:hypothetical protein
MSIANALLPEFDQEMAATRRVLERVADDRFGYKPHPKSWTMLELATHVATIPSWMADTIRKDELDIAPEGAPPYKPPVFHSAREMVAHFDQSVLRTTRCSRIGPCSPPESRSSLCLAPRCYAPSS